jgi:hypothetical protein
MRIVEFDSDDAIPKCESCERKAMLYIDVDGTSPIIPFCRRHTTQLFTKIGKILGFVE